MGLGANDTNDQKTGAQKNMLETRRVPVGAEKEIILFGRGSANGKLQHAITWDKKGRDTKQPILNTLTWHGKPSASQD